MAKLRRLRYKIKNWLWPAKAPKYKLPPIDDYREAIAALSTHPGFQYLMLDLANKKANILDELKIPRVPQTFDGIINFAVRAAKNEEAIYWIDYLQTKVQAEVGIIAHLFTEREPNPSLNKFAATSR